MLFIFILQRVGLVRIDVRLPSGALAAQQALNNSKNQQEERVETMCWGGREGRWDVSLRSGMHQTKGEAFTSAQGLGLGLRRISGGATGLASATSPHKPILKS